MANRTLVPRFSSPRHRILPQSLAMAFLAFTASFGSAGWFACGGSLCQKHGHPFQPWKILKITRTGLGVSTQPLSFHPWFLWVIDDKLQAEEKHPKTLLFWSWKGYPHKSYKNATGQTRCSQRVIRFEPPKKRPVLPYQNMANRSISCAWIWELWNMKPWKEIKS